MDNSGYVTLNRQSGLMREMQLIANNIANSSTTGFRREGTAFAEYVAQLGPGEDSLSMANASVRWQDLSPGSSTPTNSPYDLAIQGEGFFLVETPNGPRLTRAGSFLPNAEGELVTPDGLRLLDAGAAPISVPTAANAVAISADGTISADGVPVGQVGVFQPNDPTDLLAQEGTMFDAPAGYEAMDAPVVLQGFLEQSNVNPVRELTRMIEVQRAYEQGQKFLENEHDRIRGVIQAMSRSS